MNSDCNGLSSTTLPKGWQLVRLGDFAPLSYGKSLPQKTRDPSGSIPVYGSNGIVGFHDVPWTQGPTVIVGRKGSAGKVHYSSQPCWPIDTTFYVTDTDEHATKFKYYLLKSLGLDRMNTDSAVPGLNRNNAHALVVKIPSPSEQRRIARALDDKLAEVEKAKRAAETQLEAVNSLVGVYLLQAFAGKL